jgi:hypothetical protein
MGYRDWVIQAFNQSPPLINFHHRANRGDRCPTPPGTTSRRFHRNTMFNEEGGLIRRNFAWRRSPALPRRRQFGWERRWAARSVTIINTTFTQKEYYWFYAI